MAKTYTPLTDEQREARMTEAKSRLEQGVERMRNSDEFRAYLASMANFHQYSFVNCMLIWVQCPHATRVAGFNDWKNKHARYVRKGETGIKIWRPIRPRTKLDAEAARAHGIDTDKPVTLEGPVQGFTLTSVFDVSQTDGAPLPTWGAPSELTEEGYADVLASVLTVARDLGYHVTYGSPDMDAKGYFTPGTPNIVLKPGMASLQTLKTLVHEMAHALGAIPFGKDAPEGREQAELLAEGTAFTVLHTLGADTSEYSFRYLTSWGGNADALRAIAATIHRLASKILDAITPAVAPDARGEQAAA